MVGTCHGIKNFERLARDHGIFLIEDAAQALGSNYQDSRHIGTAGDLEHFRSFPKLSHRTEEQL